MSFNQEISDRFDTADGVEAALYAIAIAIQNLAIQVKFLGNGDASTPMGAIEALGKHLGEKIEDAGSAIAGALDDIAAGKSE